MMLLPVESAVATQEVLLWVDATEVPGLGNPTKD